jgi:signal transduction histidine kinase
VSRRAASSFKMTAVNPLRALLDPRTYRALLYLLTGIAVAPVAFALLLAGWLTALLLAITPASVPVLLAFRWSVRQLAAAEAWLARELLGSRTQLAPPRRRRAGFWAAAESVLGDAAFWRQQVFLVLQVLAAPVAAIGELSLIAFGGGLVALPVYYSYANDDFGFTKIDSLGKAFACVPVGLAVLAIALVLVRPLAGAFRSAADGLLGSCSPAVPIRPGVAGRRRRLALETHALFYALLNLVLIAVWALSGGGYFWPEWTLITLGLPLAVHAWVVLVETRWETWSRLGVTMGLAIHAGVTVAFSIFFVLVWAVTTRGYFWPFWPILALVAVLAAHAIVARPSAVIRRLRETRAGAVDAQESDLRRIERNLHDGAQARLVALGMSLGLAEQQLASDPEAARKLVAEARAGVGEALRELRDLARGIHPPILTDRGLAAAIAALADRSPIPVTVDARVTERPPAAVETAAYFVVAESIANAGKHAGATAVRVRIERRGDVLQVEVADDGRGGADPTGNGLRGLRQRVEALDGAFTVTSPPAGPTTVRAELPCAS